MNYIKKKIKGKKNVQPDDDDLDPDQFHVAPAPPGAPKDWVPYDQRIDHDSEEWLAFKQLTQRVTSIVEESKHNLTKIVATTALDEATRTIKEVTSAAAHPPGPQPKKAPPPRPQPPARPPASKAPAPTPPTSICPTSDFDQDKRFDAFAQFDGFEFHATEPADPFDTCDIGFGFCEPPADLPVPDLVLDVDRLDLGLGVAPGERDPFDTSFVDRVDDVSSVTNDVSLIKSEVNLLESDVDLLKGDVNLLKSDVNLLKDDANLLKGDANLFETNAILLKTDSILLETDAKLLESDAKLFETNAILLETDAILLESDAKLFETDDVLLESDAKLFETDAKLFDTDAKLFETDAKLFDTDANLLEGDVNLLSEEDKNLSNFFETQLTADSFDEDPFVIREDILASIAMDPFDLFLQSAASSAAEEPPPPTQRARSPNPFLVDDCAGSTAQLHSSNPFAMDDDAGAASAGGGIFDLGSLPNPFAEFHAAKAVDIPPPDLFDLGFDEPLPPPPKQEVRKMSEDLFMEVGVIRRPSNPFCQPDDGVTSAAAAVRRPSNDFYDLTSKTSSSSDQIGPTFDPFAATSNPSGTVTDIFGGTHGWLTSPDDENGHILAPKSGAHPPPIPPQPQKPFKLLEEKLTQSGGGVAPPPPRPPPPSKPALPPARPPPPSLPPAKDDFWEMIKENELNQSLPGDAMLFDDLIRSRTKVVDGPVDSAISHGFDILLQEDRVEFEPITVNINITEATPTPKVANLNSFFCNNDDVIDSATDKDEDWAQPASSKELPRPPSIDMNTQIIEEEPPKADLEFEVGTTTDDVRMEANILEENQEKEKSAQHFVDTSAFEEFEAKFSTMLMGQSQFLDTENVSSSNYDPFSDLSASPAVEEGSALQGFGPSDDFDHFFGVKEIPAAPQPSPAHFDLLSKPEKPPSAVDSPDSDDSGPDFSVFIRPKMRDAQAVHASDSSMIVPVLAPPPAKSPQPKSPTNLSRFNPFDKSGGGQISNLNEEVDEFLAIFDTPPPAPVPEKQVPTEIGENLQLAGGETGSEVESLGSPVFEADDSEPLEDFYPKYDGHGWEMMLRQPSKKKLTGQRYWKKIFIKLSDNGVLHLFGKREDKDPFQELPLQACYSLSEVATQQYDQYGKIFTVKLQYVFYRERVGVRPGQINKVTQGQITSLGQLAKLGLPLEHAPQVSQLLKLGSLNYEELKDFVRVVEDALFHLTVHRDRALTYKTEEIQVTVIDELRAEVANNGVVLQQVARVRVFFLAFIGNMPDVEIGLNDITKQGKEVVGRHDIIPVVTEEWIRLEKCQFHSCVVVDEFDKNRTLKLHPPDACFFELMRFRIRPPKNRELPLQVRTKMTIIGNRVEIRADVIVPGCISRKHGQIPCEDVAIRFPLPECWIYLFRTEKHFRYGSIKSAARRPGKIKGLDRFMGAGSTVEPSLIEVSTGQAKYEHQHRAIVWRVPKLPKEGQGAYSTYLFVCRMELSSYDQIPEEFDSTVYVEFSMPTTTASHTTVRSVSVTNPNPPEKYVKYLARHSYRVGIEHANVTTECEYVAATGAAASNAASAPPNRSSREPSEDAEASLPSN